MSSAAVKGEPLTADPEQVRTFRAASWAMFSICSRCGEAAWCAGRRRRPLYCLRCYPANRRRRRTTT